MQEAARAKRVDLHVLKARTESEIDGAFATLVQLRVDWLVLGAIGFRPQIATPALRHSVPAIASQRDFRDVGGLLSYGPGLTAAGRQPQDRAGARLKGSGMILAPADEIIE